jgi:hypothetical protein
MLFDGQQVPAPHVVEGFHRRPFRVSKVVWADHRIRAAFSVFEG